MACVTYECFKCGEFWTRGGGNECPSCGSRCVHTDWDEALDFQVQDAVEEWEPLEAEGGDEWETELEA